MRGVLLERPAQGLVLHLPLRRQAVGEGGQEGEGVIGVALVLGEVERHAADESPLGIALAQIALRPAGMPLDLGAGERVEVAPPAGEDVRVQVFQPGHGRGLEDGAVEIGRGRRDLGDRPARFRDGGPAEFGEVEPGDRASELERRRQRRRVFARGVEHPASRARRVGIEQCLRDRPIRGVGRRFPEE